MRTIAQAYIEEGEARGIEKTAMNMIKQNADIKFIASVTGFTKEQILKLKDKAQYKHLISYTYQIKIPSIGTD